MMEDLYYKIIKDIGDFRRATSDVPKKILLTDDIFIQLKANNSITRDTPGNQWRFEDIPIKVTDSINKDWIVV